MKPKKDRKNRYFLFSLFPKKLPFSLKIINVARNNVIRFLKNICCIKGMVVPDSLTQSCIIENEKAEKRMKNTAFFKLIVMKIHLKILI